MPDSALPNFTGCFVDGGRLYLTHFLGSGAYGIVYKAFDTTSPPHTPTQYAVKFLGPVAENSSQGSPRDEREFKLHSICSSHPNVATIHRRFTHQNFLFIVLELSAGGQLFNAIGTGVFRNNDALVRGVFLCLVDAVRHCHECGVYHRDLKPENILCSADGANIRVADFGLATDCVRVRAEVSQSLTIGRESETYELRQSDVWALCVILLNMISGLYPWRRAIDADAGFAPFLVDGGYLRGLFPISRPLNDLLGRAFQLDPRTRPTLLQLCAEIVGMDRLFVAEDKGGQESQNLLPLASPSGSTSRFSSVSFVVSSPTPSTDATSLSLSLPAPASFDTGALPPITTTPTTSAASTAGDFLLESRG